jgi:ABC-type transporter Mla subunit MlaD
MEGRANYFRVGLLLIGGIAIALGLVWFLRGGQVSGGTVIVTYFPESVQGLQVGSEVQYLGVTVGRVTQIGVVSAKYGTEEQDVKNPLYRQVYVMYTVDASKFGRNIPSPEQAVAIGLRARLQSQFITNLSYIDLDFVDPLRYPVPKLPWKPEAVYVPSVPSAFAQVRNAGQQLLSKLDQVDVAKFVTQVTKLAETLDREMTSGDLHATLASTQHLLGSADTAVKQADLPALTANLEKTSDALRQLANNPDTKRMLSQGAQATERLNGLLARLTVSVNQLQASLGPFLGNMQAASANLRELTASLRAYPGQVLSGPPPPVRGPLH